MINNQLKKRVEKLIARASFHLRPDVMNSLKKAYRLEKNKKSKRALGLILDNADIARRESLAICQDTGLPVVFIEAGRNITIDDSLVIAVKKGIEAGYKNNFLRPSIVDPLLRAGSSYKGSICHLDFSPNLKGIKITILWIENSS